MIFVKQEYFVMKSHRSSQIWLIFHFNPKSTGLFSPGTALGECFPTHSVKLDSYISESWNLQGW